MKFWNPDLREAKSLSTAAVVAVILAAWNASPSGQHTCTKEPIKIEITAKVLTTDNALANSITSVCPGQDVNWEFINNTGETVDIEFTQFHLESTGAKVDAVDFDGFWRSSHKKGTVRGKGRKIRSGKIDFRVKEGDAVCIKYTITVKGTDRPPTEQDPRLEIARPGGIEESPEPSAGPAVSLALPLQGRCKR